jgi:acetyl-CoA decarbonylase/synthase complex subunit gamma
MRFNYLNGFVETPAGTVPRVATRLDFKDYLGTLMVRWAINRDHYRVEPGIYATGNPTSASDVFVTGNYKLSFDHLRKNLDGLNAWMLVLDTRGINVWCAAGKGTFSAKELVKRIQLCSLEKIVNHQRLILPQLAATGVSAQAVKSLTREHPAEKTTVEGGPLVAGTGNFSPGIYLKRNTGYSVIFGPVRASDIKSFIDAGYKATPGMRKVRFGLSDRAKLIPVDFVSGRSYLLAALTLVFFLSGIYSRGYSFSETMDHGLTAMINILMGYAAGVIITPLLLPYLPARTFSMKGMYAGLAVAIILLFSGNLGNHWSEQTAWFLIIPAISSFIAMNFTGSSTFTSLSGVKKEMKISIPFQIAGSALGLALLITSKFL